MTRCSVCDEVRNEMTARARAAGLFWEACSRAQINVEDEKRKRNSLCCAGHVSRYLLQDGKYVVTAIRKSHYNASKIRTEKQS